MVTHLPDSGDPQFGGRTARRWLAAAAIAVVVLLASAPVAAPQHGAVTASSAAVTASATAASAGQFELTGRDAPRTPLRWLACRAIAYRINPAGMPKGMDAVVRSSMALIGQQTGVTFRYAGTTKRVFTTTSRPATPTIYFAFTPKRSAYGHRFSWPGEIGVGGPSGAWYEDGNGRMYEAITSGRVLLSTTFQGPRLGTGATWQSLIVHEVGHALNLAHRSSAADVMNPALSAKSPGRFAPDEVAALQRTLQRTGCDYTAWRKL